MEFSNRRLNKEHCKAKPASSGVWSDNLDLPLLMMSRGQSALPAIAGIEIVKPTASHGEAQGVARSTSRPTST